MEQVRRTLIERHDDTEDFVITTQAGMLEEFDNVIGAARESGFEVVRINTNDKTLNEVVDEAQKVLESRLSPRAQ